MVLTPEEVVLKPEDINNQGIFIDLSKQHIRQVLESRNGTKKKQQKKTTKKNNNNKQQNVTLVPMAPAMAPQQQTTQDNKSRTK